VETWVDPQTGQRCQRRALGKCTSGRLFLRPSIEGPADLYWSGADATGGFDYDLKMLITACWRRMAKATNKRLPTPRPLPVTDRPGVWWLCRLMPGRYLIEIRSGSGAELHEILPARPRIARLHRPVAATPAAANPDEETSKTMLRRPEA